MRFHLLSSIATGGLNTRKKIGDFFSGTYLGHSQTNSYLQETIDSMLRWLVEKRFIRRTNISVKEISPGLEITIAFKKVKSGCFTNRGSAPKNIAMAGVGRPTK